MFVYIVAAAMEAIFLSKNSSHPSTHAHFRQNSIPLSPKFLKTASRAIVKCVFNWMWF